MGVILEGETDMVILAYWELSTAYTADGRVGLPGRVRFSSQRMRHRQ